MTSELSALRANNSPAPRREQLRRAAATTHPNATAYRCASNGPVGSLCVADFLPEGLGLEGTGLRRERALPVLITLPRLSGTLN